MHYIHVVLLNVTMSKTQAFVKTYIGACTTVPTNGQMSHKVFDSIFATFRCHQIFDKEF